MTVGYLCRKLGVNVRVGYLCRKLGVNVRVSYLYRKGSILCGRTQETRKGVGLG